MTKLQILIKNNQNKFIILLASLFTVILVSLSYRMGLNSGGNTTIATTQIVPSVTNRPYPTSAPYVSPTKFTLPITELKLGTINWYQFPKVASLDAYQSPDGNGYIDGLVIYKDIKFHEVASFPNGSKLINAIVPYQGMGIWYKVQHFIKLPNGETYFIINSKESDSSDDPRRFLKPSIKYSSFVIKGIEAPDEIPSDQGMFYPTGYFFDNTISFTELKNPVLVATTKYGRIYSVYTASSKALDLPESTRIFDRRSWLRLKDDTVKAYELKQHFMTDDKIPQITWNDGTVNSTNFEPGFGGKCGTNYGSLFKSDSSLVKILSPAGTNDSGQTIYSFADNSHPIIQKIYDGLDQSSRPDFSTFLKRKNHFVWQDTLGDWWLFLSTENKIQAECAKPVIYLYPTSDTPVSVKVGANITLSEPLYPSDGWNVLAHPNGQLEYFGKTYSNLFWEGTGLGLYPNKSRYGFVVPQSNLISTLKSHLTQLGLNTQESADFMEFWTPLLPATPYVQLTWLNTEDLNILAPLQVSPAPKTVIRIFLEFKGLDKPITLIPQKLFSPLRDGFTLVEWGGLLIK